MTRAQAARPVLEFKGRMMTLTILRLLDPSVEVLARELDRRVQEAPKLFRHLPVILDVEAVATSDLYLDLPGLTALLRTRELLPVGVRGGGEPWAQAAGSAGLAVFPAEREPAGRRSAAAPDNSKENKGKEEEPAGQKEVPELPAGPGGGSLLVTQPVRSGQQVYARGGDLVILAPVSPGAEVLADGHIHIYGTLNGRALAGVHGDSSARIFCHAFRAELVSVAGTYSVSEQFDESLLGKPVQVSLDGDALRIQKL